MKNVMLDLETLGTRPNSAIIAIGAVEFDEDLGILSRYYQNVDLQSCIDKGLEVDGKTMMWWLRQSDEARSALRGNVVELKDALKSFREYLKGDNLQIWGNGVGFDNVILKNAYDKFRVYEPWDYRSDRCYRTLTCSLPSLKLEREGTHHNAVDDAEYQAEKLIKLVKVNKLTKVL